MVQAATGTTPATKAKTAAKKVTPKRKQPTPRAAPTARKVCSILLYSIGRDNSNSGCNPPG